MNNSINRRIAPLETSVAGPVSAKPPLKRTLPLAPDVGPTAKGGVEEPLDGPLTALNSLVFSPQALATGVGSNLNPESVKKYLKQIDAMDKSGGPLWSDFKQALQILGTTNVNDELAIGEDDIDFDDQIIEKLKSVDMNQPKSFVIIALLLLPVNDLLKKAIQSSAFAQDEMFKIIDGLSSGIKNASEKISALMRTADEEAVQKNIEATRKQGLFKILIGVIKAVLAYALAGAAIVTGNVALGAGAALLAVSAVSDIVSGMMMAIDPEGLGQDKQVQSMAANGLLGLATDDPMINMIVKAAVSVVFTVVTLGAGGVALANGLKTAATTAAKVGKVAVFALNTANSLATIGGSAASIALSAQNSKDESALAYAQAASAGLITALCSAVLESQEVQDSLEDAFGKEGVTIFKGVLYGAGAIGGGLALGALSSGSISSMPERFAKFGDIMKCVSTAFGVYNAAQGVSTSTDGIIQSEAQLDLIESASKAEIDVLAQSIIRNIRESQLADARSALENTQNSMVTMTKLAGQMFQIIQQIIKDTYK